MNNKLTTVVMFTLIIVSTAIGSYIYPNLPETIASHWNSQGLVDGYMPKFWGIFLMPLLLLFMYFLYIIIPAIDPLKKNLESFRKQYNLLIVLIMLFLFYIHTLTIIWNTGIEFNMNKFVLPAVGIFIFYIGVLMGYAKRNWFVGIRTPWTLSSDIVWNKTHKLGSLLFKISGFLALLSIFIPKYSVAIVIAPIIGSSLFLIIYSYFIYKKNNQ